MNMQNESSVNVSSGNCLLKGQDILPLGSLSMMTTIKGLAENIVKRRSTAEDVDDARGVLEMIDVMLEIYEEQAPFVADLAEKLAA